VGGGGGGGGGGFLYSGVTRGKRPASLLGEFNSKVFSGVGDKGGIS